VREEAADWGSCFASHGVPLLALAALGASGQLYMQLLRRLQQRVESSEGGGCTDWGVVHCQPRGLLASFRGSGSFGRAVEAAVSEADAAVAATYGQQ
jgi:hypothetical protein